MAPINDIQGGFNPIENYKQKYLAEQCKSNIGNSAEECKKNVWQSVLNDHSKHQQYWDGYMDLTTKMQKKTNPALEKALEAEQTRIKEALDYASPEATKARERAKKEAEELKRQQEAASKRNPMDDYENMFNF